MNRFTTPSLLLPPSRLTRWLAALSAVLVTVLGVVGVTAPAAQAAPTEATATVFDTPEVRYVNVRDGTGTEYAKIGQVNAGETVTLECFDWTYGAEVQGPYSSSRIWYKLKGYDNGWVSDAYLETGSNDPVVAQCDIPWPVAGVDLGAPAGYTHFILLAHYTYSSSQYSGRPVKLPWSFFGPASGDFAQKAYDHPIGEKWDYASSEQVNGAEFYLSLGKFNVVRTSPNCFRIWDTYDFDWSNVVTTALSVAANTGNAREFNVYASGCYPPGSDLTP